MLLPDDPERIGQYRLEGRLGAGGMGTVYLARSPGGRRVAVKVIRPEIANDPEFRVRFAREAAAARQVSAFYTAPVIDADVDGPAPWLATAYVPGPSLDRAIAEHGPFPVRMVRALGAALAEGLAAIHAAGLVHRDLKPSNVLLSSDGPHIIDFGLTRAFGRSDLTRTGMLLGTPGFMSPEQVRGGPVGPASDVFGLGLVLAYAAAGHAPFGAGPPDVVLYRVVYQAPDLSEVPGELRPLIARLLAKEPADRPTPAQIMAELGDADLAQEWLAPAAELSVLQSPASLLHLTEDASAGIGTGAPAARSGRWTQWRSGTRGATSLRPRRPGAGAPPPTVLRRRAGAVMSRDHARQHRDGNWLRRALAFVAVALRLIAGWVARIFVQRSAPVPVPAGAGGDRAGSDWLTGPGGWTDEAGSLPDRAGPAAAGAGVPPGGGRPPLPPGPGDGPDPEEPEPDGYDPALTDWGIDPDRIADRAGFAQALRQVRALAGLTNRQIAAATGLPARAVRGYFGGRHLPAEAGRLPAILAACSVAPASAAAWEAALARVQPTPRPGPPNRAGTPQVSAGQPAGSWVGDFPASILWLSADSPASVVDLLGRRGVSPEAASVVVSSLAARHQEMMLADTDLRHQQERLGFERALLAMRNRHDAEKTLAEAGVYAHQIQAAQLNSALADLTRQADGPPSPVPFLAAPFVPPQAGPVSPLNVELHQQFIRAADATVILGRHGTVNNNAGVDVRQVLELLDRVGGGDVASLRTAVQELGSDETPADKRSAARKKILSFVGQLADNGKDVAAAVIVKYLATLSGLPS